MAFRRGSSSSRSDTRFASSVGVHLPIHSGAMARPARMFGSAISRGRAKYRQAATRLMIRPAPGMRPIHSTSPSVGTRSTNSSGTIAANGTPSIASSTVLVPGKVSARSLRARAVHGSLVTQTAFSAGHRADASARIDASNPGERNSAAMIWNVTRGRLDRSASATRNR